MAEVKMGTNYVREIAANFRAAAPACKSADIKARLETLANEMEPLAGKLYFKTQKGTEEMQALAAKVEGNKDKLGDEAFIKPIFAELDRLIDLVKNMKVRMT
jgi:hypothetical protein